MHFICLIIFHGPGIELGTFGLVHECSTTELTEVNIPRSRMTKTCRETLLNLFQKQITKNPLVAAVGGIRLKS